MRLEFSFEMLQEENYYFLVWCYEVDCGEREYFWVGLG